MARKPRINLEGGFYHVMLRGNAGGDIFFDESDRERFLELAAEGVGKFGHRLHAYCLMTNHIHLLVQIGTVPLSRIMQNLTFRYAKHVNGKYRRWGHVFQGRFKSILIDADEYLLELIRYIHLNPVRANIVKEPLEYRWTSHRVYMGREKNKLVESEWSLELFSSHMGAARRGFGRFVKDGIGKESTIVTDSHDYSDARVLGDDDFLLKVLEKVDEEVKFKVDEVIRQVCREYNVKLKALKSRSIKGSLVDARKMLSYIVREHSKGTLTELGRQLGREQCTMSIFARQMEEKIEKESSVRSCYETILERLYQCINA